MKLECTNGKLILVSFVVSFARQVIGRSVKNVMVILRRKNDGGLFYKRTGETCCAFSCSVLHCIVSTLTLTMCCYVLYCAVLLCSTVLYYAVLCTAHTLDSIYWLTVCCRLVNTY